MLIFHLIAKRSTENLSPICNIQKRKQVKISVVFIAFISLLMFILRHQNVNVQQQLLFGAKARLGLNKGVISTTAFSPDRTQIAGASSIGIWLYDAATGTETDLEPAMPIDVSAIFIGDKRDVWTIAFHSMAVYSQAVDRTHFCWRM